MFRWLSIFRVPAGAPPQLRDACRVLSRAAALLGVLSVAASWLMPAPAQRLLLVAVAIAGAGALSCWANAVRYDAERRRHEDERRAMARYLAELAGNPDPTPSRLHVA
jgi:hypothetical protein